MTNPYASSFSKGFEDALSNTDENDINDLWITTNNNNVEADAASKPASATIVTVVRKGGQTATASSNGGGGGSADSMRTVFSNSTNALGFGTPNVPK